ncbi:Ohr family peroxiredoxin [Streptosporangium sp. NPDC000239]|uniref:Ohr family peroxiredoxin n=1 Tax=Streptosporangium jomthongense TaxID=1193683 RepID=A0ABV8F3P8_9ACTN
MNDPILSTDHDYDGSAFKPLYVTSVEVSGGSSAHGRATGRARSADGALDLELRMPEELGGDATGPNPEQLFAAGYAACFHGALSLLARQHHLDPAAITVEATVAFGRDPADGGYQLRADLVVNWPGATPDRANPLLTQAAALCPYTKMTRQGIPTTLTLAP